MKKFSISLLLVGLVLKVILAPAQSLEKSMSQAASVFLKSLNNEEKEKTNFMFDDQERFDWHFVPRDRKGLSLKYMNSEQRANAMNLVKSALSKSGALRIEQIMDLENVLRVIENRPPNDVRRDPDNFAFSIFGDPTKDAWAWRIEGHHVSLNFTIVKGKVAYTPSFFGSNPGIVLADVPQKNRNVLHEEQMKAFTLLQSLSSEQLAKTVLSAVAPNDIVTFNKRKALLDHFEGISYSELTKSQKELFTDLLDAYLSRYHVSLRQQQWSKLKKQGLDKIYFTWMGDQKPELGKGKGHYYRIHGPTFLIEFDNTQNDGNHIHSVVRDLENDFGDDLLKIHYENNH